MAGHDQNPQHSHGSMDTSAQEKTFARFIRMATWAVGIVVGVLVFLALANV